MRGVADAARALEVTAVEVATHGVIPSTGKA